MVAHIFRRKTARDIEMTLRSPDPAAPIARAGVRATLYDSTGEPAGGVAVLA